MKLKLLLVFTLITCVSVEGFSQDFFKWYEDETITEKTPFRTAANGTFTPDQTNPSTTGNSNTIASKVVQERRNPQVRFTLSQKITDVSTFQVRFKAYTELTSAEHDGGFVRAYLECSACSDTGGTRIFKAKKLADGQTWEELTYDFSGETIDPAVVTAGGYDQLNIFIVRRLDAGDTAGTYYFDTIEGTQEQTLSIGDNDLNDNKLLLYPTYVTDEFEISKEINSAEIYNAVGQKVKTFKEQKTFNVSNLAKGLYFFKASLNHGTSQTLRFVKK